VPSQPTAIGPFHIERELGRGGMGVVYLARDTRLDRQVAIKALPDHLVDDPDRLVRFEREAKVLASLNHPGLGAIYGLESHERHQYLVLEYIEGETLADILRRGPIPLDDALPLAKHIAEAVEAAHSKGVVHRDLKPGNVMITPEGRVKVLDFGLARTAEGSVSSASNTALSQSPTLTSPVHMHSPTIAGAIMGTAGYMSPEQARGKPVDKRSDIFSFGCILFEMLTGSRPFVGETVSDSVAATLHLHPDLGALGPSTPRAVTALLKRCLAKDREHRLQDIGDARVELEQIIADPGHEVAAVARGPWWRSRAAVAAVGFAALALILGALAVRGFSMDGSGGTTPRPVVRATLPLPKDLTCRIGDRSIALSPDGSQLVVVARPEDSPSARSLYLRDLSKLEFRPLAGTADATYPFWSPDGKSIAFFADAKLKRLDLADGIVRVLCDAPAGRGGTWGTKGTIVFAPSAIGGLLIVSDSGGTPTPLTTAKQPNESHRLPQMLPDGERLLFYNANVEAPGIYAFEPGAEDVTLVLEGEGEARFVEPGHLAFVRDTNLLVQPFDAQRLLLTGVPRPIAAGVGNNELRQFINVGLSAGGTLVYQPRGAVQRWQLAWMGRDGVRAPIALEALPIGRSSAMVSPDGRRAVTVVRNEAGKPTVVILDLERGTQTAIGDPTWRGADYPVWCADTQRILCSAASGGVYGIGSIPLVGGGSSEMVWSEPGVEFHPSSVTGDGQTLFFSQWNNRDKIGDLMTLSLTPGQKPVPMMTTPVGELLPKVSPSGTAVAYLETAQSFWEGTLKVISFPSVSTPVTVSGSGSAVVQSYHWLADDELSWVDPSRRVWSATITAKNAEIDAGLPKPMLGGRPLEEGISILAYDRPRERFLVGIEEEPQEEPPLVYVSDWRRESAGD
jgi:tRNA A-37 threonylcarbamoyl transferase component Bud32/Tol biopolymer transport system component